MNKNTKETYADEILDLYQQIEYKSTTDNKWYKLKDYYPFAFPVKNEQSIIALDTGGEQGGDFGWFKIDNNKLLRQDIDSHKWEIITEVRFLSGLRKHIKSGIVAVERPFKV